MEMSYSRNSYSLVVTLLIALLVLTAFAGLIVLCQTNNHAQVEHGPLSAAVAASFDETGKCSWGNSVVMQAKDGRNMFVCFEKSDTNKIDLHVQTDEGKTVTDIPSSQMSRPAAYLKNAIDKWGYKITRAFGDWPQWFDDILDAANQ
jgi:hypothetical protein